MSEKRLFLLDAYALIFRAYYALIKMPRVTADGFNTSAVFGFVTTLEEVLRKENPSHIAVCFDPPGPTFRNEAFEQYKGERSETPEDIKLSVPIIKEILKAYNIPVVEVAGFEADDVIGTLALKAEKEGFTTYMMTPDKDFGQLVSPNVLQYKPAYRGQEFELRGEEEICARFGIRRTEQVIDILALMGDKIDNIPGCPGVGDVTAQKLIKEFDSVENLLENTDRLKGAIKKKVEENAEQIRFSKFLATIRTDVPTDVVPDALIRREPDREKLFAIFKSLEFRTLTERVKRRLDEEEHRNGSSAAAPSGPAGQFPKSLFDLDTTDTVAQEAPAAPDMDVKTVVVDSAEKLARLSDLSLTVEECGLFLVDEGENDVTATCFGVALAIPGEDNFFIPSGFKDGMAFALDLLARSDIRKVTAGAKRIYVVAANLRNDDSTPLENFFDVQLTHYLLQPDLRHETSLLTSEYLHFDMPPHPGMKYARRASKNYSFAGVPDEETAPWAALHARAFLLLEAPLQKALEDEGMTALLAEVENPLAGVLARMELTGVCIDEAALNDAAQAMQQRIDDIEKEIFDIAGERFNVGSPSKVGEILFDKMGLDPKAKKTKTGQYSTGEEILEKLTSKSPIVALILKYRQLKKLLNTYLTALPAAVNPATGRVHTNYNQTVTATGRISSSSPNLQNIPVRDDEGREIRRAFIPSPGNLFLSADYSQIELRLVADMADDETMLEAFRENRDIHAITAAKIYNKDIDEVDDNERRSAKTANFGILYGISAFGLANRLGIPRQQAKELIDSYFATFPTIHKYMSDSVEYAREHGYVRTRMGRKRRLPDINSRNPVVRGYAERNAINAPIQGTAADIIKVAMVNIDREMRENGLKSKMIMQVHDELNFDVVPTELSTLQEMVSRRMQEAYDGKVSLTASSGVADNWLDAH